MTQDEVNASAAKQMADWIATQPGTFILNADKRQKIAEAFVKQLAVFGFVLQVQPVVLSPGGIA